MASLLLHNKAANNSSRKKFCEQKRETNLGSNVFTMAISLSHTQCHHKRVCLKLGNFYGPTL